MILDASAAASFLLPDEAEPGDELLERLTLGPVLVPQHWPLEIISILQNAKRRRRIDQAGRDRAMSQASSWSVRIDPLTSTVAWSESLRLADEFALTIYDAAYLELAIRTKDTLASNDKELVAAARRRGVDVLTSLP
ncbi:type II toxin-antitoxin system VapC family toxin [Sphingomonas bacterium]|uniref:type II toxin-antitoxin system VapC family toxin n=1 Tax=Sphingomonas bacterium TaxID=1895847 RepID=UPI0015752A15|nr:type II toxin-antitoxin system VapC family toxin [Sphingomonas bacterium]